MGIGRAGAFIALFAVTAPAFGQTTPYPLERYRVTLKGGGLGVDIDETVIVSIVVHDGKRERWIAERRRRDHNWCASQVNGQCSAGDKTVHDWIDGNSCPALTAALEDLARLKVGGFAPPARSGSIMITDTPLLTVSGTPDGMTGYGAHMALAGFTGPVVDWWSRSERSLAQCWTPNRLTSNGRQLDAQRTL
ncbi:hypothetical protein [Sphingomonas sp. GC_Shp_3]|uniref:hypothetical protein n=1 Tax=Sphingomonas sp. GC_Shp_3 TaxID=2937383 RepID=UPI00226ADE0E|nr:hypothetical protein [Sphingomonas sp. GC_Shp_3]